MRVTSNRMLVCRTRLQMRSRQAQLIGIALMLAVLSSAMLVACAGTTGSGGNGNDSGNSGLESTLAVVVHAVTNLNLAVINTVGTGGIQDPIVAVPASAAGGPLISDGKPTILYIGAGYSPYSAAERWSVIVALSHFGIFSSLHLTTSSSTDVYPNTPTFTFYGSSYVSMYLDFQAVEETGQDQNIILQTPTLQQDTLLYTYDTNQYVGNRAGGEPFLDLGNRFIVVSSGYSPQLLSGFTQLEIASRLSNADDPITRAIIGNANWLAAAICELTNNHPFSVCATGLISRIEALLPKER